MMNTDSSALSTRVGYRDLQYQRDAEFLVEADRNKHEITILLDLDVSAAGGFFTGECQWGMTPAHLDVQKSCPVSYHSARADF